MVAGRSFSPRRLAEFEGFSSLDWAPDGSHLIYTTAPSGELWPSQLWRVWAAGGDPRRLNLDFHVVDQIRFQPNGRHIAFRGKQEPEKREVWVLENFLSP